MKQIAFAVVCSGVLVLAPPPLAAQSDDQDQYGKEIEDLKAGQQQIRKDLAEIKKLLQARPAPAAAAQPTARPGSQVKDVVFDLGDNPVKGESTAKLTLVEFSDYQ